MARPTPKPIITLSLLFVLSLLALPTVTAASPAVNKLTLTKIQKQQYALVAEVGGQRVSIVAHLSDQLDWAKADDCVLCDNEQEGATTKDGQEPECTGKCDEQGKGVKCNKSYCKRVKQSSLTFPYYIKQGQKVQLKIKEHSSGTKLKYHTIMATKMLQKIPENGRINLLNGPNGLFGSNVVLVKDHAKDITAYYYGPKDEEESGVVDSFAPLFAQVKIIEDDRTLAKDIKGKKGEITGLVIGATKTASKQVDQPTKKQKNVKSDPQKDQNQQNQQEQQVNLFDITQIKIKQLYKTPTKNIQSESKDKKEQQDPSVSKIAVQKTTAEFSIKSNKLVLPLGVYKKLTSQIISRFFPSTSDSESCKFEESVLSCTSSELLNLQRMDNVTIILTLNSVDLQFPIRALVETCTQKSCTLSLSISKNKKSVIVGDFILNIFAMQYNKKENHFILYRLNNQWAQNFLKQRQYYSHEVNFMWMFIVFIFKAIMWVLKVIAVVSATVLMINCLYHWKDVFNWVLDILAKLTNKSLRDQFKEQQMGKFNKMSMRIKDRLGKKFKKPAKFTSMPIYSDAKLGEQLAEQSDRREQKSKLMSLDDLSDHQSSVDEDHEQATEAEQTSVKGSGSKREQIEMEIIKEKEELERKMSAKGQLPTILKSIPKAQIKKQPKQQKTKVSEEQLKNIPAPPPNQQQFYQFDMHYHQSQFPDS